MPLTPSELLSIRLNPPARFEPTTVRNVLNGHMCFVKTRKSIYNYYCTLEHGHDGPHIAHTNLAEILCVWHEGDQEPVMWGDHAIAFNKLLEGSASPGI